MLQERRERKTPDRQAVIFLVYKEGKILLEERIKPGSGYYGYTIIPGGGVEDGESPKEAAKREIKEELGVIPVSIIHLDRFEDVTLSNAHILFDAYLIDEYRGDPVNKEPEKSNHVWVPIEDAFEYLPLVSSRHIIDRAINFLNEAKLKEDL